MFHKAGDDDTICAVSTPPGSGGIAVIRVSGPQAFSITRKVCGFLPEKPESHRIYYGIAKSSDSAEPLDEVLVSCFADGRSFTGEETTEVSCHGGTVITATLLKELIKAGCRTARRGEFTYRAFMNGRLDLVQAESVLTLIESQSRQSAKVALRQLQGHLSADFARIEDDLVWLLAQLEASIDFSTEGIEVIPSQTLLNRTNGLIAFVDKLIGTYNKGRLLKEGLQVALVGKPNAGKSSLLNALLKEDRAIVTEHAGTTRDLVEGHLSYGGVPVTLVDTAGLRETENEVERIGIERSRSAMQKSDVVFFVIDLSSPDWKNEVLDFNRDNGKNQSDPSNSSNGYYVFNKVDLDSTGDLKSSSSALLDQLGLSGRGFWVSALRKGGLSDIESFFEDQAKAADSDASNVVVQARHLELLQKIHSCLGTAVELIKRDSSPEFIAFELQEAVRAIHELLGKEFDEQVIDRIFKEFCLGK